MELAFAFLSRAAECSAAGTVDALGVGFETLALSRLSAQTIPIALVAKFRYVSGESGQEHDLAVDLTAPDGRRSHLVNERVIAGKATEYANQSRGATVVSTLDATFERGGEHVFHLMLDGTQIAALPLHVVLDNDGDTAATAMQMRGDWMRQLGMSDEEIAELCDADTYPGSIEDETANIRALERMRSSNWSI